MTPQRTVAFVGYMTGEQWLAHPVPHGPNAHVVRVPVHLSDGYKRHVERVIDVLGLSRGTTRIDEVYDAAPFKKPGDLRAVLAEHGYAPLFTVWAALIVIPPTMRTWQWVDGERRRLAVERLRAWRP